MDEITLTVLGDPIPWARQSQNVKTGGRFIPSRQLNQVGRFIVAWERSGGEMFPRDVPVALEAEFRCKRPGTHFGTGRNAGVLKDWARGLRPLGRPDLDNLLKLGTDALTTQAWMDDDQVVEVRGRKLYVDGIDDPPRSILIVRRMVPDLRDDPTQSQLIAA